MTSVRHDPGERRFVAVAVVLTKHPDGQVVEHFRVQLPILSPAKDDANTNSRSCANLMLFFFITNF
jgi:hypothetical protein